MLLAGIEVHCLRDLTRGGLATAVIEIAETAGLAVKLDETAVAVTEAVRGACEILGLDPFYVANEGRFAAFVPAAQADLLRRMGRRAEAAAAYRRALLLATNGSERRFLRRRLVETETANSE